MLGISDTFGCPFEKHKNISKFWRLKYNIKTESE